MDKRFFLALLLTGVVVIATPIIFPRQPIPAPTQSTATPPPPTAAAESSPTAGEIPTGAAAVPVLSANDVREDAAVPTIVVDTVALSNALTQYRFSTQGAAFVSADLPNYRQLGGREGTVSLSHGRVPMLHYRLLAGGDTIHLDRFNFAATEDSVNGNPRVTFNGVIGRSTISVSYVLSADNYLADVNFQATGLPQPAFLLTDLPSGFDSQEADSTEDRRHLAFAVKPANNGAKRIDFRKPDPGEIMLQSGPLTWAVAKSKYFLVGVLTPEDQQPVFAELHVIGAPRVNKVAVRAHGTTVTPITDAPVNFELYAGPLEWQRLVDMGREFQNANPYGGFANTVVQPFATIVMRILLWMKRTLQIEYGWILVIFGVAIRLAMWPLNTRMMRSSIQMQRIAPQVQEAQNKHKGDPEKQREAVMKIYREAGVSPFAALSGCLPMLLPMPILFALFFVFQNTIEFRGVSFLWLADISLKDPYYILPFLMGGSMYLLSWVGTRNVPPNPQTKMLTVLMPVILTVALLNFASGLNLYYAVQNLAALPQQWLIANERAKASSEVKGKGVVKKQKSDNSSGAERKKR